MSAEERRTLSKLRLDKAQEALNDAKSTLEKGRLRSAINRAYYAAFHAMRAMLALNEIDRRRHSGVTAEFLNLYVKTGLFDASYPTIIRRMYNTHSKNEYDDIQNILYDDAVQQVQDAETVVESIKHFLSE